jgi:hypothetical protein
MVHDKNMTNTNRYRVYDLNDKLCGVWYAANEVAAISAALSEGYDAWSTIFCPPGCA